VLAGVGGRVVRDHPPQSLLVPLRQRTDVRESSLHSDHLLAHYYYIKPLTIIQGMD
jgi:hypothetical protein